FIAQCSGPRAGRAAPRRPTNQAGRLRRPLRTAGPILRRRSPRTRRETQLVLRRTIAELHLRFVEPYSCYQLTRRSRATQSFTARPSRLAPDTFGLASQFPKLHGQFLTLRLSRKRR